MSNQEEDQNLGRGNGDGELPGHLPKFQPRQVRPRKAKVKLEEKRKKKKGKAEKADEEMKEDGARGRNRGVGKKEEKKVSFAEEDSIIGGFAVENAKAGKPRKNFSEEP